MENKPTFTLVSPTKSVKVDKNKIEKRTQDDCVPCTNVHSTLVRVIDPIRFSCLNKLLQVTALVLRFINNCRTKGIQRQVSKLSANELKAAELCWIKHSRHIKFAEVHSELLGIIYQHLFVIDQLQLYIDLDCVIHCKGRLQNTPIIETVKHLLLLPKDHVLSDLIVHTSHESVLHDGITKPITKICKCFWIPCICQLTKTKLRSCIKCHTVISKPFLLPNPPPLLMSQVLEVPCFYYTVLDYLGPLYVTSIEGERKCYVCRQYSRH